MNSKFGIITACWKGDYFLVKATCASIRHFLGDVPICVVVDGDFSIQELESLYGVCPLYLHDVSHPELRRRCSGSGRSKLAALWEGPFDYFLYLDSDAIVWGNIFDTYDFRLSDFDFVVLRPNSYGSTSKEAINQWFFDVDQLHSIVDSTYDWENQPYFCTGAFAARKNCLDLEKYLELEDISDRHPNLFQFWEQGILNFMVLSLNQSGTLKTHVLDLQLVTVDHPKNKLEEEYSCSLNSLPVNVKQPKILHFCGRKPFIHTPQAYSKPFTACRIAYYQKLYKERLGKTALSWSKILEEEAGVLTKKIQRRLHFLL
jgi:hypothetical protein